MNNDIEAMYHQKYNPDYLDVTPVPAPTQQRVGRPAEDPQLTEEQLSHDPHFQEQASVFYDQYRKYEASLPDPTGFGSVARNHGKLDNKKDIADWAIGEAAWFRNNASKMLVDMAKLSKADPEMVVAFHQINQMYGRTPDTGRQIARGVGMSLADPLNMLGIMAIGKTAMGSTAGKKLATTQLGVYAEKIMAGRKARAVATGAVASAEGAGFTALAEGGEEKVKEMATGEAMDWQKIRNASAVGAVVAPVLVGGVYGAAKLASKGADFIQKFRVKRGEGEYGGNSYTDSDAVAQSYASNHEGGSVREVEIESRFPATVSDKEMSVPQLVDELDLDPKTTVDLYTSMIQNPAYIRGERLDASLDAVRSRMDNAPDLTANPSERLLSGLNVGSMLDSGLAGSQQVLDNAPQIQEGTAGSSMEPPRIPEQTVGDRVEPTMDPVGTAGADINPRSTQAVEKVAGDYSGRTQEMYSNEYNRAFPVSVMLENPKVVEAIEKRGIDLVVYPEIEPKIERAIKDLQVDEGFYSRAEEALLEMNFPQWSKKSLETKSIDVELVDGGNVAQHENRKSVEAAQALQKRTGAVKSITVNKQTKPVQGKDIWAKFNKADGVKAAELKELGLEDFLLHGGYRQSSKDPTKNSFTQEEVQDYINTKRVLIETVVGEDNGKRMEEGDFTAPDWEREYDYSSENWYHRVEDMLYDFDRGDVSNVWDEDELVEQIWPSLGELDSGNGVTGYLDDEDQIKEFLSFGREEREALLNQYTETMFLDEIDDIAKMKDLITDPADRRLFRDAGAQDRARFIIDTFGADDAILRAGAGFRDIFQAAAERQAEAEYVENPAVAFFDSVEYGDDTFQVEITGNDDYGYRLIIDGETIDEEIYSTTEVDIQMEQHFQAHAGTDPYGEDDPFSQTLKHHFDDRPDTFEETPYDNYREFKLSLPKHSDKDFTGSHWPQEDNIFANMIVTDREIQVKTEQGITDTVNAFFIEENQSDWNTALRKRITARKKLSIAYRGLKKTNKYVESVLGGRSEDKIREIFKRAKPDYDGYETYDNKFVDAYTRALAIRAFGEKHPHMGEVNRIREQQRNAVKEVIGKEEFPRFAAAMEQYRADLVELEKHQWKAKSTKEADNPFMGDDWLKLSMKKSILEARGDGKEYLAWSNGRRLQNRWGDGNDYSSQYDRKMVKFITQLTGNKPTKRLFDNELQRIIDNNFEGLEVSMEGIYTDSGSATRSGHYQWSVYFDGERIDSLVTDLVDDPMTEEESIGRAMEKAKRNIQNGSGYWVAPLTGDKVEKALQKGMPLFSTAALSGTLGLQLMGVDNENSSLDQSGTSNSYKTFGRPTVNEVQ